ncbi:hypothetical protein L198_03911 [Cryptococcus wingfieldii CBS 7118]|uniref:Integral membrane protein n=1 Tax=Cryptococcus wingfieldii CBS 7118 TaxID=1295528 RepID=A0A1E3J8Z7_9TREE|nr:hypothetical protein L198_03911 [Cryptococcus wingfieldii CBS 7118]ODN97348.1 hypothetical protein L198_03911 [Cryptococcus wingfieldii CBS 7118]
MSSNTTDISDFNFTGGFPTSTDLAPSIVFLAIHQYVLAIPVLVFRLVRKQDRTMILIRPAVFVACRLGSFGLRAWMSKNTYNESELIAELVMISIGALFLIAPLISCWTNHVESEVRPEDRPRWLSLLSKALHLLLMACIATAVVGSSMIGSAIKDPSKMDTVTGLRRASLVLSVVVVGLVGAGITLTAVNYNLSRRGTAWLYVLDGCLLVITVYKLAQFENTDSDSVAQSRVAFWILQILFAFSLIMAISLPTWFSSVDHEELLLDIEMGGQKNMGNPSMASLRR